MIQVDSFKLMLISLGFSEKGDVVEKYILGSDCYLKVDFSEKKLIFPESNGLKVNERQTCNFASSENAVVFECVHRLLEKGYKPAHIELEPKWKIGHGASGGRADILVRDYQNEPLLIIECKTYGREFDKAWKNTQEDGAQLFSYIEQEKATQFVCLYASQFDENSNQINVIQKIISVKDNPKILLDNPKLASFSAANNNKERFRVWKDTYQLEATETGLFEDNIQPYQIGKDKYTLLQDTKIIGAMDIKGAYHRFRTILRKHNVSRRENAFEVLVNLFLCKIVDELEHPDDLKFYWKGIAYDNYFDLVDRLQLLYKTGMERFLDQDIVYVSNEHIDDAFWAIKQKPNATEIRIKELFRELKFYKGLDFEFIKVFNKEYFNKNAKILLEIIQMWQGLRLTGSEQNQFLGDMFEYFLDNGIKQTEGQFFTPVPICKFIVSSLPLEQLIEKHSEPIQAIDYACGSGHFLTEYAQQIPELVQQIKQTDDPSSYYQGVYGIEKEDRLAKVAKVSAFMYGRKEINIIDADALVPHAEIKEAGFQVLIANPPFAVEDFLLTVDEDARARYTLMDKINDDGNRNIQCFFLERAKQLLAGDGVMGVIVPSSVLSNSDTVHVATREILLQYFDIVAITELGNRTFGKTGTNTVVLFLRRKAKRPEPAEHYRYRVQNFFTDWQNEVAGNGGAYLDVTVVERYCEHVGLSYQDYQSLLLGDANNDLLKTEIFSDYRAAFDAENEIKKLKVHKLFKQKNEIEQHIELQKRFNVYARAIEQDKLYYFMLAINNPCPVVLVKSPADNKEQKQFLGYEWSGAKGSEGVIYNGGDTVYEIQTPMFDPKNRNNDSKISYLIRQNFLGESGNVPEPLQSFVSQANLIDLLDFSRKSFDKAFSLNVRKMSDVSAKWGLIKIEQICEISRGRVISHKYIDENSGVYPVYSSQTQNDGVMGFIDSYDFDGEYVTWTTDGVYAGTCFYREGRFNCTNVCGVLKVKNDDVITKYLPLVLNQVTVDHVVQSANPKLMSNVMANIQIPLPPLNIQQKIVEECEAVDEKIRVAQRSVAELNAELKNFLLNQSFLIEKLATVAIKVSENIDPQQQVGLVNYIGLENIESQSGKLVGDTNTEYKSIKSAKTGFITHDVLYGKLRPNLNKVYLADFDGICSTDILVFRFETPALAKFYAHYLRSEYFNQEVIKTVSGQQLPRTSWGAMSNIKIPVPPLAEQAALVAQIEAIEEKITQAQAVIDAAPAQKQAILKKYL